MIARISKHTEPTGHLAGMARVDRSAAVCPGASVRFGSAFHTPRGMRGISAASGIGRNGSDARRSTGRGVGKGWMDRADGIGGRAPGA